MGQISRFTERISSLKIKSLKFIAM